MKISFSSLQLLKLILELKADRNKKKNEKRQFNFLLLVLMLCIKINEFKLIILSVYVISKYAFDFLII